MLSLFSVPLLTIPSIKVVFFKFLFINFTVAEPTFSWINTIKISFHSGTMDLREGHLI